MALRQYAVGFVVGNIITKLLTFAYKRMTICHLCGAKRKWSHCGLCFPTPEEVKARIEYLETWLDRIP